MSADVLEQITGARPEFRTEDELESYVRIRNLVAFFLSPESGRER